MRRRERATVHDTLGRLAEPLHPVRGPRYDHFNHKWFWKPPWWTGKPDGPVDDGEVLGRTTADAEAALIAMRMKVSCEHGKPIGVVCPDCRERVVRTLRGDAA